MSSPLDSVRVDLSIASLSSNMEYQYERILLAEVGPLVMRVSDGLSPSSAYPRTLHVTLTVLLEMARGIMSQRSIPTMMHVHQRLRVVAEEKEGYARSLFSDSRTTSGLSESHGFQIAEPASPTLTDEARTALRKRALWRGVPLDKMIGKVDLQVANASFTFFKYTFRDSDGVHIGIKAAQILVNMDVPVPTYENYSQSTHLGAGTVSLQRAVGKAISPAEERSWTPQQWFDHIESFSKKNILVVPKSTVDFEGFVRKVERRRVEYSLRANFSAPIDVALNFSLYRYLISLGQLYAKAMELKEIGVAYGTQDKPKPDEGAQDAAKAKGDKLASPTRATPGKSPEKFQRPKDDTLGGETTASKPDPSSKPGSDGIDPHAPPAAAKSSSSSAHGIDFVATGPVEFYPHLQVTGEATPKEWLEWLAGTKEAVPSFIFTTVTETAASAVDGAVWVWKNVAAGSQAEGSSGSVVLGRVTGT
ncbi:hypothetical protein M427DRAFT_29491 [Gonapodya prolifera JEL478]|uniref:Uncharacterized protein n=1 Tax=Gonapodya prolifera (strain JEL478) TaxID=1344416 RepID=A0A139APZ1_GONPJ|nr:hypothetical protein M427DRAFT_29491 [Gonapodya prolifera JEL478]|eukprot:KXS18555.1 hypothetical protein M427DRAFT_29491 [Gonapodya prolifera JEL478]